MSHEQGQAICTRRLGVGDEHLALRAIERLVPLEDRKGRLASVVQMRKLLTRPEDFLIVSVLEHQPVGFLLAYQLLRADCDALMVYLYDVGVDDTHRRKGIATQMIALLKECCQDQQVDHIWVGASESNRAARALYLATGAEQVSDNYVEFVYPVSRS